MTNRYSDRQSNTDSTDRMYRRREVHTVVLVMHTRAAVTIDPLTSFIRLGSLFRNCLLRRKG